ncbi:MAG: Rrf2 family transcriptional regulator [Clostridia bacterium]
MRLSTRSRYGLKAIVDLAVYYGEGPVALPVLASLQGISESYLEQLLRALKKVNVVETVRGVQGGYSLSRDPSQITVQEVLSVLEGSTAVVDCVDTESNGCKNACTCSARPLFLKLQTKINDVLSATSIQDLADDYIQQKRRLLDAKGLS